ncbi:MAG TPA: TIM barrel protein [Gemmatimonadaceae bacterium]|jgi:hydroxypyruvate isomerase|nr:TIM barrel protein [Gemmatimonadaceae bacterium]
MPTRREFVQNGVAIGGALAGLGACASGGGGASAMSAASATASAGSVKSSGSPIKQSVCKWCYDKMTVDELAVNAKRIGLHSVELIDPPDFETVAKHGLVCAMTNAPGDPRTRIPKGFNRVENHSWLIPLYNETIVKVKQAKFPNLICFSGNRAGLSDDEGLENCAKGLKEIMPVAEREGVTICMELLNSKVNHPDYQCDHTAWGVKLVQKVGSERFKLLYDIYHMQIMEGDVIRTIRDNHRAIGHYHTGGNPGRHEIDESQELYYPAIMRAIQETGFTGYVAQEFVPVKDPMASLEDAYRRCAV